VRKAAGRIARELRRIENDDAHDRQGTGSSDELFGKIDGRWR
jgi:hypothetical protein